MLHKFREKLIKRLLIVIIGSIISTIIWEINARWGNNFTTCLSLSTTTFLLIYIPFEIYWSFRDIWFDRWTINKSQYLETSRERIMVENGKFLSAQVITSKNREKVMFRNTIIIINHGFSDTKESLQYFYLPLALQGYVILAYDARGTGASKKAGKRKDFVKRIEDHELIVNWIKKNEEHKNKNIISIGFSVGAITALIGGFSNERVQKIIAIAAISDYKNNSPKFNPIIVLYYLLKGVNLNPDKEKNRKISPLLMFQSIKEKISMEQWLSNSRKVFLIHSKNDRVVKFKNFKENLSILKTPHDKQVIFKKGGHSFKKNECELVGTSLKFLSK